MPIDEYERMQEICAVAEQFELYGIIAERSKTPHEEYVSLAAALNKCGVKPDEISTLQDLHHSGRVPV